MQVQTGQEEKVLMEEKELTSELQQQKWSVVSFESVAVRNLTYDEARVWLEKLEKQKISGLCIITDEAAERMAEQKN